MSSKYPHLFSPVKIRNTLFKNRIMSAPLGAWTCSPDNYIYDYAISMFEEKAKGGAAALCVGHTEVNYKDEDSDGFGLYFDLRKNEGTGAITTFVQTMQQYGCHASMELNYGGLTMGEPPEPPKGEDGKELPRPDTGPGAVQRVAYDLNGGGTPNGWVRPLTKEKMQSVIADYARCVRKMRRVGFHMVTIHGAHGWVNAKFLSPKFNKRADEYGGSLENRMRFPLELMRAVRAAAGDRMVVEYRVSGIDPDEDPQGFEELVMFLNKLEGIADIIHISSGDMTDGGLHTFPSYLSPRGTNRHLARALRGRINIPMAVVGAISQPEMAEEIIANDEADFVAMCRTLIADPQWPNKVRRGQEDDVRPCIACYNCLDQMHETHFLGCDVNPRCGMEHRVPEHSAAPVKKDVVVVGGGPAGMQAAMTAFDRGHRVTLLEKAGALGGLLRISDDSRVKWMLNNYKNYLVRQVCKRDIDVRLNTEATPELVESLDADAVIVACGSSPIVPKIPGVELPHVFTCTQAHDAPEKLGDHIVIVGGNLVGCETALHLRDIDIGKGGITVIEMTGRIHSDGGMVGGAIDVKLEEGGINVLANAKCVEITEASVRIEKDGVVRDIPCDSVILAVGMRSNYDVYEQLLGTAPDVEPVGDCIVPGTVRNASRNGYFTAYNL